MTSRVRVHVLGDCQPEDHDRSLPDAHGAKFCVSDKDHNYIFESHDMAEAMHVAGERHGFVSIHDQAVDRHGLLGCNDCGEPLYYCSNDNWYHHVDPNHECFMIGAEGHDYRKDQHHDVEGP